MTAPTRYIEDARIDSPVSVDGQTYRLVTFRLECGHELQTTADSIAIRDMERPWPCEDCAALQGALPL